MQTVDYRVRETKLFIPKNSKPQAFYRSIDSKVIYQLEYLVCLDTNDILTKVFRCSNNHIKLSELLFNALLK